MPKVTLTERDKDQIRLFQNLKLIQGGRTAQEMGEILGCSLGTYYQRLKKPEQLTYKEIKRLCSFFKVDMNNFMTGQVKVW